MIERVGRVMLGLMVGTLGILALGWTVSPGVASTGKSKLAEGA